MAFHEFLQKFPEAALPLTLSEEDSSTFSLDNEPLTERMIEEHILPVEEGADDDMTEFVPCFRLPQGKREVHALVWWRAGLLNYQYVLVTFTEAGKPVTRWVIAGTFSDGKTITRSVARIDEDWSITIVSGQVEGSTDTYDAAQTTTLELEILPDGKIVELGN